MNAAPAILAVALFASPAAADREPLTVAELLRDVRVLRDALEEGHSGLTRYRTRAEVDRVFDEVTAAIDHPMDALELYRRLAPAVAVLEDGHVWIRIPQALQDRIDRVVPLLPLRARIVGTTPYVFRDLATPDERLAGLEIRSIGGIPAQVIIATLVRATPSDGTIATAKLRRIENRFQEHVAALLDLAAPFDVVLRDRRTGTDSHHVLAGMTAPDQLAWTRAHHPGDLPPPRPADCEQRGRIGLLTVRSFDDGPAGDPPETLTALLARCFRGLADQSARALILDLRDNPGGEDELGLRLLSYLVEQPFRYYTELVVNAETFAFARYAAGRFESIPAGALTRTPDGRLLETDHENLGIHAPAHDAFHGPLFVLVNGRSFSTTAEVASHLDQRRRATFVGEESGGGYYGNTSGYMPVIELPASKLRVRVPLVTYYLAIPPGHAPTRGVLPAHAIEPSIEDAIAGRDPVLELALSLAAAEPRPVPPAARPRGCGCDASPPSTAAMLLVPLALRRRRRVTARADSTDTRRAPATASRRTCRRAGARRPPSRSTRTPP